MKRKLTDSFIKKSALPHTTGSPCNYSDGGGLYLHVKPTGKYWRYNYRYSGKMKTLSLGAYPEVSLKLARERHEEARELLVRDIDPIEFKKASKTQQSGQTANSLESISREWFLKHLSSKSATHRQRTISYLERDVFPWLGSKPVHEIRPMDITPVIERIQRRVKHDSHLRVLQSLGQVFRYAIATGRAEIEPTASLKGMFTRNSELVPFPAITEPEEVGRLMRAIDNYSGSFLTQCALKLSALAMLRPSELIGAEWQEIDFETATWTVEIRRMKAAQQIKIANQHKHIIPLSKQAISIFKELYPLTGKGLYVFPGYGRNQHKPMCSETVSYVFPGYGRNQHKPMCSETVSKALHRMGFKGQMTAHGFRSMASTMLNEMGTWNPDAVERQLSHKDKNRIRGAYNRGQYLEERREMMQAWADYLDKLKAGGKIRPFRYQVITSSQIHT